MFKGIRGVVGLAASGLMAGGFAAAFVPAASAATTPQQAYVTALYQDFLGRAPDSGGLAYYSGELGTTAPPSTAAETTVITQILTSAEYRSNLVASDYTNYLNRNADSGGAAFWLSALQKGTTDTSVAAQLLSSNEVFVTDSGSNFTTWLTAVYSDVLNRSVDSGGSTYWSGLYNGGKGESLNQIATAILTSPEAEADMVSSYYQTLLGRSADSGGLNYYVGLLHKGQTPEQVQTQIATSTEFYNDSQS